MALFLLLASFVSGFFTVVALNIPIANSEVPQKNISLTNYYQKKGTIPTKKTINFASLITPPTVLGATSSSEIETEEQVSAPKKLNKSAYTIAFLGDSMIDTLGPGIPHLAAKLKAQYPTTKFTLINHGVGASNIEYGLTRLTNNYSYLGEGRNAVLSENADIIVIESFAYNHWENTKSDLDRHWLAIAKLIETVKSKNSNTKIILAASIAPHCPTYTDGSANLPPERKQKQCETVKAYLQNMMNFANSEGYPLADAYHASKGDPKYINAGDHIHPSDAGKNLFAEKVAAAIKLD